MCHFVGDARSVILEARHIAAAFTEKAPPHMLAMGFYFFVLFADGTTDNAGPFNTLTECREIRVGAQVWGLEPSSADVVEAGECQLVGAG
jgi:hypothetical protein